MSSRRNLVYWAVALAMGALSIRAAGCAAGSTTSVPFGAACDSDAACMEGGSCVRGHCVAAACVDMDRDRAGLGPGCDTFDCDDADPTIPTADGSEACNDRDDNCNGAVDERCPCTEGGSPVPDGSTRPCGVSDCAGTQACRARVWSTCEGGRTPMAFETCFNDLDDNCDGAQDEGCCPGSEARCPGTAVCSSSGICA